MIENDREYVFFSLMRIGCAADFPECRVDTPRTPLKSIFIDQVSKYPPARKIDSSGILALSTGILILIAAGRRIRADQSAGKLAFLVCGISDKA